MKMKKIWQGTRPKFYYVDLSLTYDVAEIFKKTVWNLEKFGP